MAFSLDSLYFCFQLLSSCKNAHEVSVYMPQTKADNNGKMTNCLLIARPRKKGQIYC